MSSASPTDPVIPYAMENSSGRYCASAAPGTGGLPAPARPGTCPRSSSADPGTEPLPPARIPRLPAKFLLRLLVAVPARGGHLSHEELPGEQTSSPGRHPQRRLRAQDAGQVRQPLGDRRRVVIHDVVDPGRAAADCGDRCGRGIGDLNERPDPGPAADDRYLPLAYRLHQEVPGARPVEAAVAQHDPLRRP